MVGSVAVASSTQLYAAVSRSVVVLLVELLAPIIFLISCRASSSKLLILFWLRTPTGTSMLASSICKFTLLRTSAANSPISLNAYAVSPMAPASGAALRAKAITSYKPAAAFWFVILWLPLPPPSDNVNACVASCKSACIIAVAMFASALPPSTPAARILSLSIKLLKGFSEISPAFSESKVYAPAPISPQRVILPRVFGESLFPLLPKVILTLGRLSIDTLRIAL